MIGLVAFLMAQAASPAGAYPLVPVLNESRDTCALLLDPANVDEGVVARGWQPLTFQPSGWLTEYLKSNREIGSVLGLESYDALYQKRVADRELILYVYGLAPAKGTQRPWGSCEVMDLAAAGRIAESDVLRWAGREPVPSIPLGDNVVVRWVPSLSVGAADSSVTYSPPGSPLAALRPGLIYTLVMPTGKQSQ